MNKFEFDFYSDFVIIDWLKDYFGMLCVRVLVVWELYYGMLMVMGFDEVNVVFIDKLGVYLNVCLVVGLILGLFFVL